MSKKLPIRDCQRIRHLRAGWLGLRASSTHGALTLGDAVELPVVCRAPRAVRPRRRADEVTLGGRRVAVERPRARTADGASEVPLASYAHFGDRAPSSARWLNGGSL
ncbi:MAG TPA: hypothetical protein VFY45_16245 [Baekduia sp.]|nr:hypothetical protein [Baekduia sp.]